jgi:hypothetical protein
MKKIIIALVIIILIGVGVYFFTQRSSYNTRVGEEQETAEEQNGEATEEEQNDEPTSVIGRSVEERDITAYHFGNGDTELLFVGGIHGGYSWNTALVAYELADYLEANPDAVPENVRVTVVPVLNPDGLYETVGTAGRFTPAAVPAAEAERIAGRFNANDVDLNRNFDCDWQSQATWQNRTVDGGSAAFSEPEARAIRDYITANSPEAVVVWYSAVGGVFASNCHEGVLPETRTLTNLYADASGYPAYEEFNFYEITGDMVNWLAKEGVPAVSVLLTNHEDIEWEKNRAGIEAFLEHYAE